MKKELIIAVFFILIKCISVFCVSRPIIGILAQEFSSDDDAEYFEEIHDDEADYLEKIRRTDIYIAGSYVKGVEGAGGKVVPIFTNQSYAYYEKMLYSINGMVFPGGDISARPDSPYYKTLATVIKIAEKMNDRGTYFPIFLLCLGLHGILTLYNDNKFLLTKCNANHENYPLKFEPKFMQSLLFSEIDYKTYVHLKYFPITVNNHHWCVTPRTFNKSPNLTKNFKITSTSVTSRGIKFIASVEHKRYPFIAIQFHPEKVIFEWAEELNLPSSQSAVQSNRHFYDVFVKLSRLNSNKFSSREEERKALINNYKAIFPRMEPLSFAQVYILNK